MPHNVEEVIHILQQVKVFIDQEQDVQTVAKAHESMVNKAAQRHAEAEVVQEELRTLSQALAAARASATRPTEVPSSAEHSRIVNQLDGERFNLFKSIKEAEETMETREAELVRARDELKALESRDVVDEVELDGVALRLKMCKDLGFDLIKNRETGEDKILVRSQSKEVHSIPLEEKRSQFDFANLLWELSAS